MSCVISWPFLISIPVAWGGSRYPRVPHYGRQNLRLQHSEKRRAVEICRDPLYRRIWKWTIHSRLTVKNTMRGVTSSCLSAETLHADIVNDLARSVGYGCYSQSLLYVGYRFCTLLRPKLQPQAYVQYHLRDRRRSMPFHRVVIHNSKKVK